MISIKAAKRPTLERNLVGSFAVRRNIKLGPSARRRSLSAKPKPVNVPSKELQALQAMNQEYFYGTGMRRSIPSNTHTSPKRNHHHIICKQTPTKEKPVQRVQGKGAYRNLFASQLS
jgi:hypothetical protein